MWKTEMVPISQFVTWEVFINENLSSVRRKVLSAISSFYLSLIHI